MLLSGPLIFSLFFSPFRQGGGQDHQNPEKTREFSGTGVGRGVSELIRSAPIFCACKRTSPACAFSLGTVIVPRAESGKPTVRYLTTNCWFRQIKPAGYFLFNRKYFSFQCLASSVLNKWYFGCYCVLFLWVHSCFEIHPFFANLKEYAKHNKRDWMFTSCYFWSCLCFFENLSIKCDRKLFLFCWI